MYQLFRLIVLILLNQGINAGVSITELSSEVIRTQNGKLRGVIINFPSSRRLRPVTAYLGVQYASLRNGKLRFMPPTGPPERTSAIDVMMKKGSVCPQPHFNATRAYKSIPRVRADFLRRLSMHMKEQTEDCLTLNIYVPTREWNETKTFPVMVYIHGASYSTGSGNAYDGSVLASFGRVIMITVNFRLGVLGYLTVGRNKVPGNYALQDIIAALHWIGENVGAFGGDPASVTLFGHGYGAALVDVLRVSPVNRDNRLFRRAILQSGTAFSPYAIVHDSDSCTKDIAENANCSIHVANPRDFIACLRATPVKILVKNTPVPRKYFSCLGPTPSLRSMVLPRDIEYLYKQTTRRNIDTNVMYGFVKNEAYDYFTQSEIDMGLTSDRKTKIFRTFVHNMFTYQRQRIYEILAHYYTDWSQDITSLSRRDMIMRLLSDGVYIVPALKAFQYNAKKRDSFMYVFNYTPNSETLARPMGTVHGDELPFVFGAPLVNGSEPFPGIYNRADRLMSETVITYWTNFAKSGNPNTPGRFHPAVPSRRRLPTFPVAINNTYLQIGPTLRPSINFRSRQVISLWLKFIVNLHKPDNRRPEEHLLVGSDVLSSFDAPDQVRIVDGMTFPPPSTRHTTVTSSANIHGKIQSQFPDYDSYFATTDLSTIDVMGNSSHRAGRLRMTSHIQVSITIGVGCSLLILNIFIFAAIYYQREKIRRIKSPDAREDRVVPSTNNKDEMNHEHERIGLLANNEERNVTIGTKQVNSPSSNSSYSPTATSIYTTARPITYAPSSTPTYMNSHLQYNGDNIRVERDPRDNQSPHKDQTLHHKHNRMTNSVTMV